MPIEVPAAAEIVKHVIENQRRTKAPRRKQPAPLWSRVGQLTGHGSGYSQAICREYGFNPDEIWAAQSKNHDGWTGEKCERCKGTGEVDTAHSFGACPDCGGE